jgi:hypothetical protein
MTWLKNLISVEGRATTVLGGFADAFLEMGTTQERFHTINYRAYGSMRDMNNMVVATSLRTGMLREETKKAYEALAAVGAPKAALETLVDENLNFTRVTGTSNDAVARFQRTMFTVTGGAVAAGSAMGMMIHQMQTVGLNAHDIESVMGVVGESAVGIKAMFGPEEVMNFTRATIAATAAAKKFGDKAVQGVIDMAKRVSKGGVDVGLAAAFGSEILFMKHGEAMEHMVKKSEGLYNELSNMGRAEQGIMLNLYQTDMDTMAAKADLAKKVNEEAMMSGITWHDAFIKVSAAQKVADDAAKATEDNINRQWKRIREIVGAFLISILEPLSALAIPFGYLANAAGSLINWFNNLMGVLGLVGTAIKTLLAIGLGYYALIGITGGIGMLGTLFSKALITAITAAGIQTTAATTAAVTLQAGATTAAATLQAGAAAGAATSAVGGAAGAGGILATLRTFFPTFIAWGAALLAWAAPVGAALTAAAAAAGTFLMGVGGIMLAIVTAPVTIAAAIAGIIGGAIGGILYGIQRLIGPLDRMVLGFFTGIYKWWAGTDAAATKMRTDQIEATKKMEVNNQKAGLYMVSQRESDMSALVAITQQAERAKTDAERKEGMQRAETFAKARGINIKESKEWFDTQKILTKGASDATKAAAGTAVGRVLTPLEDAMYRHADILKELDYAQTEKEKKDILARADAFTKQSESAGTVAQTATKGIAQFGLTAEKSLAWMKSQKGLELSARAASKTQFREPEYLRQLSEVGRLPASKQEEIAKSAGFGGYEDMRDKLNEKFRMEEYGEKGAATTQIDEAAMASALKVAQQQTPKIVAEAVVEATKQEEAKAETVIPNIGTDVARSKEGGKEMDTARLVVKILEELNGKVDTRPLKGIAQSLVNLDRRAVASLAGLSIEANQWHQSR